MTTTDHLSLPANPVRASDPEREATAERLRAAAADGRLTLAEADERQSLAYAARFRHDLVPLTADLPDPRRPDSPPDARPDGPLTGPARRRLAVHAVAVAVLAAFLVTRWAVGVPDDGDAWFWPGWPLFWITLSLVVHHRRAARHRS